MPDLASLRKRLDGATTAVLQAVVVCEGEFGDASSEDLEVVRECVGMLRQAHTLLRSCSERTQRTSGATPRSGARSVPMIAPPTPFGLGQCADALDKELQEERELASRRAAFALGAADEEEATAALAAHGHATCAWRTSVAPGKSFHLTTSCAAVRGP